MNTCGLSRILLVALLVGWVTSSLTGSELAGWVVAGAAVVATYAVQRARGSTPACPVQPVAVLTVDRHGRRAGGPR